MSLSVPRYDAPQFATPVANVYCWITTLTVDFTTGGGYLVVNVHPDAASAGAGRRPLDQVAVTLGQGLPGGATFPTLAALAAAAAARQQAAPALDPFGALRAALYDALGAHPRFAGAAEVA